MEFVPQTRRESILYQELMDTQVKLSKKNIEVKRLKRELNKKGKDNFFEDMHDFNKKIIYESINHPTK
tara:strand:- start:189 stop:392 length:204 start_codon:yes stop_codon:yes gene_type:complete